MQNMLKLTIDGIEIEVDEGTTVIQAAEKVGIEIPRYCYHPGLSIVGICRICLVQIEQMSKLQVACYTPVTQDMVVYTNTAEVLEARQAVLEFLLINHPIDCPVCDQAGECWLQNYYMEHGRYDSRMYEAKVKKHKALAIGPHVILDSERCILCSRCVRFCDEVSETYELGIFNRGDHSELLPYPGRQLDNKYSGNTIDICPVGALTDRDFRFRTRVWYLSETKSICPGCSTGCNIYVHHNDKRPYKAGGARISRLKPRYNADVNEWWICDEGRYGFTYVDAASRLRNPTKRTESGREVIPWSEALDDISRRLLDILEKFGPGNIGILLSPQMSNEDLFLAKMVFANGLDMTNIHFEVKPKRKGSEDGFLIRADKNPNTQGARNLEIGGGNKKGMDVTGMLEAARTKGIRALFCCHHDLLDAFSKAEVQKAFKMLDLVVFLGSNSNRTSALADYCLPSATFVEREGTFTNYANRVQRFEKAVEPLAEAKPDWMIFRDLGKKLGKPVPFFDVADIFETMAVKESCFSGLRYHEISEQGKVIPDPGKSRATNGSRENEKLTQSAQRTQRVAEKKGDR